MKQGFPAVSLQGSAQLLSEGAECRSDPALAVPLPEQPPGIRVGGSLYGAAPNAGAHPGVC